MRQKNGFQLKDNFTQKVFWIYMGMLGILTFVKLTFYLFHVMFPTYATRVFGYDFPVAGVFGTLNPAMIVFLVPLISALTVNIRSYTMLMVVLQYLRVQSSFASSPTALRSRLVIHGSVPGSSITGSKLRPETEIHSW